MVLLVHLTALHLHLHLKGCATWWSGTYVPAFRRSLSTSLKTVLLSHRPAETLIHALPNQRDLLKGVACSNPCKRSHFHQTAFIPCKLHQLAHATDTPHTFNHGSKFGAFQFANSLSQQKVHLYNTSTNSDRNSIIK